MATNTKMIITIFQKKNSDLRTTAFIKLIENGYYSQIIKSRDRFIASKIRKFARGFKIPEEKKKKKWVGLKRKLDQK